MGLDADPARMTYSCGTINTSFPIVRFHERGPYNGNIAARNAFPVYYFMSFY